MTTTTQASQLAELIGSRFDEITARVTGSGDPSLTRWEARRARPGPATEHPGAEMSNREHTVPDAIDEGSLPAGVRLALADGRVVTVRRLEPVDREGLAAAVRRLSPESR